jgi:nicotinamidase-related amidase
LRHPLPLLTRAARPFALDRARTCLLLQDVHAAFVDVEQGWLARRARAKVVAREFDEYTDTVRLIAPNISRLLAAFRRQRIAVVYSCLGHRAGQSPSAFQETTGWCWDLDGPDGGFPDGWAPLAGELVFEKPGWGALANPALRRYLNERDACSVVVLGTMFDYGIRQTCYELGDLGIGALVVADGVAALTHAGGTQTAGNIAHGAIKLRTTGELLDLLDRLDGEVRVLI